MTAPVHRLPAFCDRCTSAQTEGGITFKDVGVFRTRQDVESGECSCGGTFIVPDGDYREDRLGRLTAVAATPEGANKLRNLGVVVQTMLEEGATARQIRDEVKHRAPEIADIVRSRVGLCASSPARC